LLLLVGINLSSSDSGCGPRSYDPFVSNFKWQLPLNVTVPNADLSTSALMVIDMQKDFTFGSFGLPCFNTTPNLFEINKGIANLIQLFYSRGGRVVASKDWHPVNHCSFSGEPPCLNTQSDGTQTYQNDFPPHCVHDSEGIPVTNSDGYRGADFVPEIRDSMQMLLEKGAGQIVFKGFNNSYDSFSAFSMGGSAQEIEYTGGYALMRPFNASDVDNYYPDVQEMIYPEQYMMTTADLLKEWGITNVFVAGLVMDYCVRDTAFYSLSSMNLGDVKGLEVYVVSDLTRPAMDGTTEQIPVFDGSLFFLGSAERIISSSGILLNAGVHFVSSSIFKS